MLICTKQERGIRNAQLSEVDDRVFEQGTLYATVEGIGVKSREAHHGRLVEVVGVVDGEAAIRGLAWFTAQIKSQRKPQSSNTTKFEPQYKICASR